MGGVPGMYDKVITTYETIDLKESLRILRNAACDVQQQMR